jgi:hypothetical protein
MKLSRDLRRPGAPRTFIANAVTPKLPRAKKPAPLACPEQLLGEVGSEIMALLTNNTEIFGKVAAPIVDGVCSIRPWGCSGPVSVPLSDVYAATRCHKVDADVRMPIARRQRAKFSGGAQ